MSKANEISPENPMGTQPVNKVLWQMALPMILAMLVQSLYNIVDRIYVAFLSETALAAVSLTFPLQTIILQLAIGIAVGVNALLSQSLGARQFKRARQTALNGLFLGGIVSLMFMAFAFLGMDFYFRIQRASGEILLYGRQYLFVLCIFAFTLTGQVLLERLLISTGRPFYQMISQIAGALVNIILDPIMIFGWFGFPALGVLGAAIATITGEITACAIALYFNLTKNKELSFSFKSFRPSPAIIKKIFTVGIPSALTGSLFALTGFTFNMILMNTTLGETGVAFFGILFALESFIFMPVFGLNNATISIIAYNFGARNKKRILQAAKLAGLYSFLIMLFGALIFSLFPRQLLGLFNATEGLLLIGISGLQIVGMSYPLVALGLIFSAMFQALGHGWEGFWVVIFRQVAVLLPAAWLLSLLANANSVWWAFPIASFGAVALGLYFLRKVYVLRIKYLPDGKL